MPVEPVLSQSMGVSETQSRVGSLVAEIALDAVAAESGASSAVIAKRTTLFGLSVVASRAAQGWTEMFGPVTHLRKAFGEMSGFETQVEVEEGRHALISRYGDGPEALAAIVMRDKPFTEAEEIRVLRLLRSVMSAALNQHNDSIVIVDLVEEDGEFTATVSTDESNTKPGPAVAKSSDAVTATAMAATALAKTPLSLRFAAQTSLEDGVVSIVLVEADDGGPLFGVSFDRRSAVSGPAMAVLQAARLVLEHSVSGAKSAAQPEVAAI